MKTKRIGFIYEKGRYPGMSSLRFGSVTGIAVEDTRHVRHTSKRVLSMVWMRRNRLKPMAVTRREDEKRDVRSTLQAKARLGLAEKRRNRGRKYN